MELKRFDKEVFNYSVCPEWAKYAAVDSSGYAHWFRHKPKIKNDIWYVNITEYDTIQMIPIPFDNKDWSHSLIERPIKQLPEWCKVGTLVFDRRCPEHNRYQKIEVIKKLQNGNNLVYLTYDQLSDKDFSDNIKQARIRPWTIEEISNILPLVVIDRKSVNNFHTTVCSASDKFVWIASALKGIEYSELASDYCKIDGSPCGVFEHLNEKGEWEE